MKRPTSPSWLGWKSTPVKKESKVGPLLLFIPEIACILSFSENTSQRFYNRNIIDEMIIPTKSIWPLTEPFTEAINNTITIETQNNIWNQTKIKRYATNLTILAPQKYLADSDKLQPTFPYATDVHILNTEKQFRLLYYPVPAHSNYSMIHLFLLISLRFPLLQLNLESSIFLYGWIEHLSLYRTV